VLKVKINGRFEAKLTAPCFTVEAEATLRYYFHPIFTVNRHPAAERRFISLGPMFRD
jgi:hypothetical protein